MNDNKQPKITVITVCFNEPKEKIALTFKSVSSQTYKNTEWIVIDGGSKQETIEAINSYLVGIDKFICEPDNGIYDAMNKGLAIASGEFVVFMNIGDRFYNKETVENVVDCILANPAYDCFFGDVIVVDDNEKEWAAPQIKKVSRRILRYSMICHQSIFSRKTLYDTIGSFDVEYKIIADRDWVLKSIKTGAKWLYVNMFICYYDRNGVSADITKRHVEADRFVTNNYSSIDNLICFPFIKYRNIRQRFKSILRHTYKGFPVINA